jgi:hypothetical protein
MQLLQHPPPSFFLDPNILLSTQFLTQCESVFCSYRLFWVHRFTQLLALLLVWRAVMLRSKMARKMWFVMLDLILRLARMIPYVWVSSPSPQNHCTWISEGCSSKTLARYYGAHFAGKKMLSDFSVSNIKWVPVESFKRKILNFKQIGTVCVPRRHGKFQNSRNKIMCMYNILSLQKSV